MDISNQKLKEGIISKLKAYDAYIDNELPDYILVMIANKKTLLQIQNDLQLFLGDNTEAFIDWLQAVLSNPEGLEGQELGSEEDSSPTVVTLAGDEERGSELVEVRESRDTTALSHDKEEARRGHDGQRTRVTLRRKTTKAKPDSTRNQDLRSFLQCRQRGSHDPRGGDQSDGSSDEEREAVSTSLSSVVNVPKRPKLTHKGGGRLLQQALLGLGGKKPSKRHSLEGVPPIKSPDKVGGVKKVLKVKREDLDKILSPKLVSKRSAVSQVSSTEVVQEKGRGQESDSDPCDDQVIIELDDDEEHELDEDSEAIIERATLAAVKSVLPMAARLGRKRMSTEPRDLRDLITGKHGRTERTASPRFVVTLDGADESLPATQQVGPSFSESSKPERCKFWPNCKNGESCPFAHPSVSCKMFPNCKFGQKCLFIHPQCKFDSRCSRPDCSYLHTAPRHLAMKQPMFPVPVPSYKGGRFFGPAAGKFPDKSALKWTPNSSGNADDQTTALKS